MTFSWAKLLSDQRCGLSSETGAVESEQGKKGPAGFRTEFEADYDRVVYSRPFRRLARKTQVHPMAPNDHVHNRLTHSIEVASVGRSLGRRLANKLKNDGDLPNENSASDIAWILMAACAAHDIGNPPFGHAGEYAIREWLADHEETSFAAELPAAVKADALLFEGNAQTFRLTSRTDNPQAGYMRLTYATLGTLVKYPWGSADPRAKEKKKFNFFSSESEIFENVFQSMELVKNGQFVRHPLSFLSEAADDICYRVLDLEDAVDLGIIREAKVRKIYAKFLASSASDDQSRPLENLRGKVIAKLIEKSWQVFEDNYGAIMNGSRERDLRKDLGPEFDEGFSEVDEAYGEIFAHTLKVSAELGAYKALGRILKALCKATQVLKGLDDVADLPFVSKNCIELAWGRDFAQQNMAQSHDWWLSQVLDFVSGLTDNYARQLSREIEGT